MDILNSIIKKETQACLGHSAFPNHSFVEMEFHPKPGKLQQNTLLGLPLTPLPLVQLHLIGTSTLP